MILIVKRNCKKQVKKKKEYRIEKVFKRKSVNYMPNEKVMIIYLIVGLLTMVLLYQNELFPTDGHNKNEALKKTEYNELVKNINSIQTAHTSHLGFKNCL